jgi:hypothetical protein
MTTSYEVYLGFGLGGLAVLLGSATELRKFLINMPELRFLTKSWSKRKRVGQERGIDFCLPLRRSKGEGRILSQPQLLAQTNMAKIEKNDIFHRGMHPNYSFCLSPRTRGNGAGLA